MNVDHNNLMTQNLQKLLPPLVRLALDNGLDSKAFGDLVREAYVQVITEDYGRGKRPTNISRTAMLAGIGRAETRRIRKALQNAAPSPPPQHHAFSNLLREWHNDSLYIGVDNQPLPIPLDGDAPSLTKLIKKFFPDIPVTTVTRELIEVEAVRQNDKGYYVVLRDYFMPPRTNPQYLTRMGGLIRDFISTVRHNSVRSGRDLSRVEIRTIEDGISRSHEAAFRKMLDDEATRFYQRIDRWLRDKREYEQVEGEPTCRMGVGIYQIHRDDGDNRSAGETS